MIHQIKQSSFIKILKRLLFQRSHLSPYLPLLSESLPQKMERLIDDKCCPNAHEEPTEHQYGHRSIPLIMRIISPSFPILHPCNNRLLIWYLFPFIAIIYFFTEASMMLTYGQVAWQSQITSPLALFIDWLFFFILAADVGVLMNTGYLYRGMIITQRDRVTSKYLHSFFLVDLILLLILFLTYTTRNYYFNILKMLILVKFARVSQIDDFYTRRLNIHRLYKTLYVIFKQIVIIFLLSHIIGLWFYAIDYALIMNGYCANDNSLCWLYSATAYSPILAYPWNIQYFYSLYWGVNTITTISYGDIAPNNPIETIYATFMFCFGFIVYGYVVNQIIRVILWARGLKDQFRAQIVIMDTYMKNMGVKKQTKVEVRDYLEFLYMQEKNRDIKLEDQMKSKLPEDLRFQLVKSAYSNLNDKLELIFLTPYATNLLFSLTEKKYTHNQTILPAFLPPSSLLFLHRGQLRLAAPLPSASTLYRSEAVHQFVGQVQFIKEEAVKYDAFADGSTVVYGMDREKINKEVYRSDQLKEKYKMVEYEVRHRGRVDRVLAFCYLCKLSHFWKDCPDYFPDFSKVTLSEQTVSPLPPRYTHPVHNTLRDSKKLASLALVPQLAQQKALAKIQKRLHRIKHRIISKQAYFQVDMAYDWKWYCPEGNLTGMRQIWNHEVVQRRQTRRHSLLPQNF